MEKIVINQEERSIYCLPAHSRPVGAFVFVAGGFFR